MPVQHTPGQGLITEDEFDAVRSTVMDNNEGMSVELAGRIVSEAIAFVRTCATYRTARIAPSRVVDEGWHALILHTNLYSRLCDSLGGMVHHYPERPDEGRFDPGVLDRTCALMEECGHEVDRALWTSPGEELVSVAANCNHSPGPNCGPIVPMPKPK